MSRNSLFYPIVCSMLVLVLLSGCAQTSSNGGMSQKEGVGTAAGAVLGGVAGAFFGKGSGKAVAMLAGATIGGIIGNRIGAMLDDEDKKALQAQAQQALLTQPDNTATNWISSRSDATATIVPENTRVEQRQVKIVRDSNVAPPSNLDPIGKKYVVSGKIKVRNEPSASAKVTNTLADGAVVWAVGKVHNQPWVMIAKNGKSIGYVPFSSVTPAPQARSTAKSTPVTAVSTKSNHPEPVPFDLDAAAPVRTPADLDALAPTEKIDVIVAQVTCRDIKTSATAKGETANAMLTACKAPDGSWIID